MARTEANVQEALRAEPEWRYFERRQKREQEHWQFDHECMLELVEEPGRQEGV